MHDAGLDGGRLVGGAGDDSLNGGDGINVMVAGVGSDTVHGGRNYNTLLLDGAKGVFLSYGDLLFGPDPRKATAAIESPL